MPAEVPTATPTDPDLPPTAPARSAAELEFAPGPELTPEPDALYADPRLAACYDTFDGPRDDLDLYEAILDEFGARSVVDIGCGTGSLAVRLAARGLEVVGVDPARASLDVARDKPHAEQVTWVNGTAEELPALGADAAVMTGNVAQVFLTDQAWSATLGGIHRALRPGGTFVAESRRPEARAWEQWAAETDQQSWDVPGVGTVIGRPTGLRAELPLVTFGDEFTFPGGEVVTSTSTLRFREEQELRDSLADAGFEVLDIRDAPDRPGLEFVLIARAV